MAYGDTLYDDPTHEEETEQPEFQDVGGFRVRIGGPQGRQKPTPDDARQAQQQDDGSQYQNVGGFNVKIPSQIPSQNSTGMPRTAGASAPMDEKPPTASQPASASAARPMTMGERMQTPTAQPPAAAPSLTVPGSATPNGGTPLDISSTTRQFPPAPPSPQTTMGELLQRRANIGSPIPIRDAAGKMDPKYRMGFGQRLLGTLANFGSGLSGHGPVAQVGPGATNSRYAQDEAQRQGNVENLDTQIKNQKDLGNENRQLFEAANKQAYESQIGAARRETSAAQQETADARLENARERLRHNQTVEGQKAQADDNTPAKGATPQYIVNPDTGQKEWMIKTTSGKLTSTGRPPLEAAAAAGDPSSRALFYYKFRSRGGKDANNPEMNGLTPGEQRDFKNRTRENDLQMKSLVDTRKDAVLHPWVKADVDAINKQLSDLQSERDQVRSDILSHRKGAGAQRPGTNPQNPRSPQAKPQYSHYANDDKGNRIGYNPKNKQWEPVAGTQ